MNLIVAFDSSDWVGAGLGKQTRPGHTQPPMHSAPRWVAATTGISPAQPGRVGRSAGLGAVGCVWLSSRWFGGRTRKNLIVLLNISLHSTWFQTPAVAGCRVKRAGLKNLVSGRVCLGKGESRPEGGFLATNVCSCSQICHLCISPSRGSPMPCLADTQWRWGPALGLNLFRQGVTASVRGFRRGGLTCRQRSAGGQRSKFRFGCGFWQSLVVVVLQKLSRAGSRGTLAKTRQGDASRACMGNNGAGIGQSQRTSLLGVRGPRVRAMEPRYISFITVLHSPRPSEETGTRTGSGL